MRAKDLHLLKYGLGTPLQVEEERHFVRAKFVDHQEGIFAVFLCNIIDIAVHILPSNRQVCKIRQDVAANLSQDISLIGTDIKDLLVLLGFKGIQTYGKHR